MSIFSKPKKVLSGRGMARAITNGGFVGDIVPGYSDAVHALAPTVFTLAGQPELAAAYSGLDSYGKGGSWGDSLKSAGTTYGMSQIGSAATGGDSVLNGTQLGDILQQGGNYVGIGNLSNDIMGQKIGEPISDTVSGPSGGSGIKGILSGGSSGIGGGSSAISSGIGGGLSSYALPAAGAAVSMYSSDKAEKKLKNATNQANAYLDPYAQTGNAANSRLSDLLGLGGGGGASSEDILAASPGYRFALDQGIKAQDRANAARGSFYSGAALKDASEYTTGLANQTVNDYYSQLAQVAGSGLSAAGGKAANTTGMGTAQGAAAINSGNTLAQLLAGANKRIIGYGANNQPIYG